MRKSLLIASLAVISMNVLGMNPLGNNNLIGNNPRHTLTPDSSPNRNSTNNKSDIQPLEFKVQQGISGQLTRNQKNYLIKDMYQRIFDQNQTIESKNKENADLKKENHQFACDICKKDNEISNLREQLDALKAEKHSLEDRIKQADLKKENHQFACDICKKDNEISNLREQLDALKAEKHSLEDRIKQYEKFSLDLESFISNRKPSSIFQLSDTEHVNSFDTLDILAQVALNDKRTAETFQLSDTEHVNSFDTLGILAQVALNDEKTAESNQSRSDSDKQSESNQEESINQNTMTESGKVSTTPVNLENDSDVEYIESDHDLDTKDSTTIVNLENDSDVEYIDELTDNSQNSDKEYIESNHPDKEYIEPQASKTLSKKRKLPSSGRIFAKHKKQATKLDLKKILQDIPRNRELNIAERKKLSKKHKISNSHCLTIVNSVRNWSNLSDSDQNTFIEKLRNPKNNKNSRIKTVGNLFLNVDVMIKLINGDKVNKFPKGKKYAGLEIHRANARVWKILIDEELNNTSSSQSRL